MSVRSRKDSVAREAPPALALGQQPASLWSRLVLVLLVLGMLLGMTLWVANRGVREVVEEARSLQQETLPRLIQLEAFGTALQDVAFRGTELASTPDPESFRADAEQLTQRLNQLGSELPDLAPAPELAQDYAVISDALVVVKELLTQRFTTEGRIAEELGQALAQLEEASGVLSDEILMTGDPTLAFDLLSTREGVVSLKGLLNQMASAGSLKELEGIRATTRTEVQRLAPALMRVSDAIGKAAPQVVQSVVARLWSPPGLLARRTAFLEAETGLVQQARAVSQDLYAVSQRLVDLRQTASAEADQAGEALRGARRRASRSFAAVAVLFLGGLLLAGVYLRRGIVARLRRMASEVSQLAAGNLEVNVTPGGDRELAQLAFSAEIFRQNSQQLEQALAEVETSNAELSQFAYVASHDLKSPLRAISNLASWVIEDCEGQLPEESRDHLRRIVGRTQLLSRLLEDLLRYSRVGREAIPVEEFELGALIQELTELVAPEGELRLEIQSGPLQVHAQRAPLELALRNILSNAVTHSDLPQPTMQVGFHREEDGGFTIDLIDDGPGIPDQHHERVFGLFNRLDHVSQGTGMGLALVRRIADSVGGTAEIVPREDRGAHFRMRWPYVAPHGEGPLSRASSRAGRRAASTPPGAEPGSGTPGVV